MSLPTSRLLLGGMLALALWLGGAAAAEPLFSLDLGDRPFTGLALSIDRGQAARGGASLKITSPGPATVCLAALRPPRLEGAKLLYSARVKSQGLKGRSYLEMWVYLPAGAAYFSRGLRSFVSGNSPWQTLAAPFFLHRGQAPVKIVLNLVLSGAGTVWVDDLRLLRRPLP